MDNSLMYYQNLKQSLNALKSKIADTVSDVNERSYVLQAIDELCLLCDQRIQEINIHVHQHR